MTDLDVTCDIPVHPNPDNGDPVGPMEVVSAMRGALLGMWNWAAVAEIPDMKPDERVGLSFRVDFVVTADRLVYVREIELRPRETAVPDGWPPPAEDPL